jgi:BRCT domain type II-containing protein
MTMGFKADGDPPTGNPGVVEDSVEDDMHMEETTVLQKEVVRLATSTRSTSTTTTSMNGQSTGVDARFGSVEIAMDLEETTVPVVRKSVEKSGSRKSSSRFAHASTSTSTSSKYK